MIEKRIFYLWCGSEKPVDLVSNSSPRVRLVLRLYFLRAYNKKALLLARLFEQQLAERQRLAALRCAAPALIASGNRHTAVCLSLGVELLSQSSAGYAFVFSTCLQQKSLAFSKAF